MRGNLQRTLVCLAFGLVPGLGVTASAWAGGAALSPPVTAAPAFAGVSAWLDGLWAWLAPGGGDAEREGWAKEGPSADPNGPPAPDQTSPEGRVGGALGTARWAKEGPSADPNGDSRPGRAVQRDARLAGDARARE